MKAEFTYGIHRHAHTHFFHLPYRPVENCPLEGRQLSRGGSNILNLMFGTGLLRVKEKTIRHSVLNKNECYGKPVSILIPGLTPQGIRRGGVWQGLELKGTEVLDAHTLSDNKKLSFLELDPSLLGPISACISIIMLPHKQLKKTKCG